MQAPAPLATIPLDDDRRRFLRHVLGHAQVEFNLLESPSKIIGSALLTALGALGVACGFSGWRALENDRFHVVGRGLGTEAITSIEADLERLLECCFGTRENTNGPLHTDVRIIDGPPPLFSPSGGAALRILIGWRLATNRIGLMGIGAPLKERAFTGSEIDFLYHLMDHMLTALRAIADHARIHGLQNELVQAGQKIANCNARNETLRAELEETRFRLSGFNDIFHELSGLTESTQVMDAFLLVMLGIFSVQSGAILYADNATGQTHAAIRGSRTVAPHNRPAEIRMALTTIIGAQSGVSGGDAPVTVLPPEAFKALNRFALPVKMAILFQVDAEASGVLCLGKRLVETHYSIREQDLLLAFAQILLSFLKNSRSFETIERLHADQQQKTLALERTVQALSESRLTIASLEHAGERIKTAITRSLRRTTRASLMDILMILLAGFVLGVVYNYASPSGVSLVPDVWRYPPPAHIDIDDARARLAAGEILLVDARPTEFYNQRHIRDALSLPLALFDFVYMMRFSQIDPTTPIVVYGRNVSRRYDEELAHKLRERGHPHVFVLRGGLAAWQTSGFEVSP